MQSRLCNWVVGSLFCHPWSAPYIWVLRIDMYKYVINTQLGAHPVVQSMTTLACGSRSQAGWPPWHTAWIAQTEKPAECQIPSVDCLKKHGSTAQRKLWEQKYTLICLQAVLWLQHEMHSAPIEKSVIQQSSKIQVKPGKQLLMLCRNAGSKPSNSNCRTKPKAAKCCEHLYISSITASVKPQQAFTLKYSSRTSWANFSARLPAHLYPPHDDQWI